MQHFCSLFTRANKLKIHEGSPFFGMVFKTERTIKRKLSKEEFHIRERVERSGRHKDAILSSDIFVLAVYLRGIRIGNLVQLKGSDKMDGVITLREGQRTKVTNGRE